MPENGDGMEKGRERELFDHTGEMECPEILYLCPSYIYCRFQ